jgi:phage tail-like protein
MPDPALQLRFEVLIDGIPIGAFTGCDGLAAEYDVVEYEEGGENSFVHRIPGRLKFQPVKLTRPVDHDSGLLAAWFSSLRATVRRQTASITAYDGNRSKIAQWNLVGVFPTRWTGPTFSSDGSGIATETLELAHNGFLDGLGGAGAGASAGLTASAQL